MVTRFSEIRKAVAAFLVGLAGFLTVVLPLLADGNVSNGDIVAVVGALATWLGGTVAVYQVPNAQTKQRSHPSMNIVLRFVAAILVGIFVYLICMLLASLGVAFFGAYAHLIAILAGIAAFFFWNDGWTPRRP